MQIVGDIGNGKMGVLTKDQAVTWLEAKDSRKYDKTLKNNLKSSVENVLSASGSTTTGGGSKRYTFEGDPTYHESNGVGASEGVSLFYVKRPDDVAKIVGIGYHVGAQTYTLTWTHHDWSAMRDEKTLTLDKK